MPREHEPVLVQSLHVFAHIAVVADVLTPSDIIAAAVSVLGCVVAVAEQKEVAVAESSQQLPFSRLHPLSGFAAVSDSQLMAYQD